MANLKPSKSAPLVLAGERRAIESATLHVDRPTRWPRREHDDLGVGFSLLIRVDQHSGEDGAPEPMIQNLPVCEAFGRWPRLDQLPGLVVDVDDDELWDAWYGNDAPPLVDNRLEFGRWSGQAIDVRWSARCGRARLNFEGPVRFGAIRLSVFVDESIEALVTAIWGADALAHFEITRAPRPPLRRAPSPRVPGVPETVSYQLWPKFFGPRF
jgi:hypothetical protein